MTVLRLLSQQVWFFVEGEMTEIWKDIPGYEGRYQASNRGRVRSLDRKVRRSNGYPFTVKGMILTPGLGANGYWCVVFPHWKTKNVHRLVLETFVGSCPDGMEARHLNGIKTDNRLENLRWGTHSKNEQDKIRHSTSNRGERCGSSKLKETDVLEIRDMLQRGIFQRVIAKQYKVSRMAIGDIANKRTWAWLE